MPEAESSRTSKSLAQLSVGEREVCELLIARCTTKEMARQLLLSINGVDWRVRTAREKLGARDRNDLARIYSTLKSHWGQSPVTPSPVAQTGVAPIARAPMAKAPIANAPMAVAPTAARLSAAGSEDGRSANGVRRRGGYQ